MDHISSRSHRIEIIPTPFDRGPQDEENAPFCGLKNWGPKFWGRHSGNMQSGVWQRWTHFRTKWAHSFFRQKNLFLFVYSFLQALTWAIPLDCQFPLIVCWTKVRKLFSLFSFLNFFKIWVPAVGYCSGATFRKNV